MRLSKFKSSIPIGTKSLHKRRRGGTRAVSGGIKRRLAQTRPSTTRKRKIVKKNRVNQRRGQASKTKRRGRK